MFCVKKEGFGEYEIKKSRFFSWLVTYENFQIKLEQLRNEHPKARHIVWAYRHMQKDQQIDENCTDDGEPKNTSGKPTLNILYHNDIVNAAILTVRYFGGILLGTGGLVKSYTESANRALNDAILVDTAMLYEKPVKIGYDKINHLEYLTGLYSLKIVNREFLGTYVIFTLQGQKEVIERLEAEVGVKE
jgi:uncharacterized YigZ family protein